jgi:hypothetical protein
MNRERDERWAYVALGVLACAYVVYRVHGAGGLKIPFTGSINVTSVDLSRLKMGELGRALPYAAAPLIAVLSEFMRRRRAREARSQWETRVQTEGFVREEESVEVRMVRGGRGAFTADVRLTRAALYLFDRGGRRDPARFVLGSAGRSETAVTDVRLIRATGEGRPLVRVATSGSSGLTFEFASVTAEAWWSDLRRSLGKSARIEEAERPEIDGAAESSVAGSPAGSAAGSAPASRFDNSEEY